MEGLRSQNVSDCGQGAWSRRVMLLLQQGAGCGEETKRYQGVSPEVHGISLSRNVYARRVFMPRP